MTYKSGRIEKDGQWVAGKREGDFVSTHKKGKINQLTFVNGELKDKV
jgi:antitoxin component YwqK of YwqJK toxin-antitoxin module